MKTRRGAGLAFTFMFAAFVVASCGVDDRTPPATAARVAELRGRFPIPASPSTPPAVARAARVVLPVTANGEVQLEDARSHLAIGFALENVQPARIEVADGVALYRGALDGADVLQRVHAEGTEDYVVFETRPAREELSYVVDVSRVAGLRLVSNTLEFLEANGTPILRVAPPWVVDAKGERHEATLGVDRCAYDASPVGPWGRPVTKPGAERCTVRVVWTGTPYPAMVDPGWATTGSMATKRAQHTMSVLVSGKVLVTGGANATAELFDPAANGGAGTFAATGAMGSTRAQHTATVLPSGKVLVAGGSVAFGGPFLATAELYDPAGTGTFAPTGPMPVERDGHTATLLPSGKVLVTGGCNAKASGCTSALASAALFDPAGNAGAGTFTASGTMASARTNHTASLLASGMVLVAGGNDGSSSVKTAELFDATGNAGAGTFAATGSMTSSRAGHSASVLASGKVLVAAGFDGTAHTTSAELYDPGAGSFANTGSLATRRTGQTASVLPSGKVLLAGGFHSLGGNTWLNSVELYDPAGAGTFGAATPLAATRTIHRAVVLPSGIVLVAGGFDGVDNLAGAERFGGVAGDACAADGACLSGFCASGVCCNTACTGGGCRRCDLAGSAGTCTVAPIGNSGGSPLCTPYACDGVNAACPAACTSDATCVADHYCAANGQCQPRKAQASACNPQTNCKQSGCHECASGFCVDGTCCNSECTGRCRACTAALKQTGVDGVCGDTKNGLDPRNECAPDGSPCGADGQCNGTGACRATSPAGASCGASQCAGSVAQGALCDGSGACNSSSVDCAPFLCGNSGCTTSCATSADCAASASCTNGACVAAPVAATCDGDHTTTGVDGKKQDCAPYKCQSNGTCRETCGSVSDCVAPTTCDATGRCVGLAQDAGSDGCSVAISAPARESNLPLALLCAAAALTRRRRADASSTRGRGPSRR